MNPVGLVLPVASLGLSALLIRPQRGFFPRGSNLTGQPTAATQGLPGNVSPIVAQVTIEEQGTDELEITEHPVEQGAPIADHAYKRPSVVVIRCGWSNSRTQSGGLISQAVGIGSALNSAIGIAASVAPTAQAAQSLLTGNDPGQVKQIYQQLLQLQAQRTPFIVMTGKRKYESMLFRSLQCVTDADSENILSMTIVCQQVIIVATQVVTVGAAPEDQEFPEQTSPVVPQGTQSLQPAPTFVPDPATMGGALGAVQGSFTTVNTLLDSVSTQVSSLNGPISRLGDVLTVAGDQVTAVAATLPTPLNLPLTTGAQSFSASLEGFDLKSIAGEALTELPTGLNEAKTALIAAQQQLPSIASQISSVSSALSTAIPQSIASINNALGQIERVTR